MSQDAEKIKRLAEFKERIEKRIEQLKAELEELQITLELVKSILLEKGFKRAEITMKPEALAETAPKKAETEAVPPAPPVEYENVIQLKATSGELLATLYVGENTLRVVPAEDKDFNVDTPPFNSFLVERVLMKMQEKDLELARAGQLPPEKVFSYNIVKEGNFLREIYIKNVDEERMRELKSSIRWTLEKMYEKMKE
ncbi:MAG: hypothetical protein ACP5IM_06220 [Candidatus Bathyarchaeia archaeon]|nr:MAG: hypothetical protein C0195_01770 [Candidatus Bathyarchaeota archaeon]